MKFEWSPPNDSEDTAFRVTKQYARGKKSQGTYVI